VEALLVHTGQHYDPLLSEAFFRDLGIPEPDIDLEVGSGSHAQQTAEIMRRLEPVMVERKPDVVVVVGDVNSTMAAAMVAAKLGIAVAHVEAGLRSFDRTMPEEINRVVTDALAHYLFATEPRGVENLLREGRPKHRIYLVGNVMIDSLKQFLPVAEKSPVLEALGLRSGGALRPYCVLTLHRPNNVDDTAKLLRFLGTLEQALDSATSGPVIFPVHPRTQARLKEAGWASSSGRLRELDVSGLRRPAGSGGQGLRRRLGSGGAALGRPSDSGGPAPASGIVFTEPISYIDFLGLMRFARLVLTDSGGIQEETTVLGVPCLTLRDNTERPITVEQGTNEVIGSDPPDLPRVIRKVLANPKQPKQAPDLWDGHAAERIVAILVQEWGRKKGGAVA
jgi:UDP-N-acetylglucosamine 2-epimerase (non-hydrolysing)